MTIAIHILDRALRDCDRSSKEVADKVLALMPEDVRKELLQCLQTEKNPEKRWGRLKTLVQNKRTGHYFEKEVMLQYFYPRLDVNISKGVNHLLKNPFSVHPKTGRISVPIDLGELDRFDAFDVPTISLICEELYRPKTAEEEEEEEDTKENENEREAGERRKIRDYKRTSLAKYVKLFDQFLEGMARSRKGEHLKKSDLQKDF
ncbi:unnamed protein product, partial [Coregonus sp. 'balchen']